MLRMKPASFVGLQDVEQHQQIGLLGDAVGVHRLALGFQRPIDPAVRVLLTEGLGLERQQAVETLELAEDTVRVPTQAQSATDMVPVVQFRLPDLQRRKQFRTPQYREPVEHD